MLRDNFHITTLLLIGALVQGLISLLPYKNIALIMPAVLLLLSRAIPPLAMHFGLMKNKYMDGVVMGRTVPVYPNEQGVQDTPADAQVCAIILGARSNSPLGIFNPGYMKVGDYFKKMNKELDADADKYGYLGASTWLSAGDRGVSSETMGILYFKSSEALHEYAQSPLHTEAMQWWSSDLKKLDMTAIMHEIFVAPKSGWEGIYVNYHPTGLLATHTQIDLKDEQGSKKVWMSPSVVGNGRLKYSKGRMGRTLADVEKRHLDAAHEKNTLY